MIARQALQSAQYRLARYYLVRLQEASQVSARGRENLQHWLGVIQQDWEQIKKWQAWTTEYMNYDEEKAHLCTAFVLATSSHTRMHQLPTETLTWAEQALAASRMLNDDHSVLELLYLICLMHWNLGNVDRVEEYANQLAVSATALEDTLGLSRAWGMLGRVKEFRGDYDDAEALLLRSLDTLPDDTKNNELLSVWQGLGVIALHRGDYHQAATYHERILETAKAARKEVAVGIAHLTLSGVLISLGDYPAAEYHAEQAVIIAQRLKFTRLIPATFLGLANAKKWLGKYDDARNFYEKAIAEPHLLAPVNLVNALQGRGQVAFFQGDRVAALDSFEEALANVPVASLSHRCDVSCNMVIVYAIGNDMEAAHTHLKVALSGAQMLRTTHFMAKAISAAVIYWRQAGEVEQAAVCAGALHKYAQQLRATLFDPQIYGHLEAELGEQLYQQALERGKTLALEAVISEVLLLLD